MASQPYDGMLRDKGLRTSLTSVSVWVLSRICLDTGLQWDGITEGYPSFFSSNISLLQQRDGQNDDKKMYSRFSNILLLLANRIAI